MTGIAHPSSHRHRRLAVALATAVAMTLLLPTVTLLVATWLAGWRLQPLETASMRPAHEVGSLLVVSPPDVGRLAPGATVVFEDPAREGRLVAHRITGRVAGSPPLFRTKGDANPAADVAPVSIGAIRGEVRWSIPGAGRVVTLLRWPTNFLVLVALPALVLLATEAKGARRRHRPARVSAASKGRAIPEATG